MDPGGILKTLIMGLWFTKCFYNNTKITPYFFSLSLCHSYTEKFSRGYVTCDDVFVSQIAEGLALLGS